MKESRHTNTHPHTYTPSRAEHQMDSTDKTESTPSFIRPFIHSFIHRFSHTCQHLASHRPVCLSIEPSVGPYRGSDTNTTRTASHPATTHAQKESQGEIRRPPRWQPAGKPPRDKWLALFSCFVLKVTVVPWDVVCLRHAHQCLRIAPTGSHAEWSIKADRQVVVSNDGSHTHTHTQRERERASKHKLGRYTNTFRLHMCRQRLVRHT